LDIFVEIRQFIQVLVPQFLDVETTIFLLSSYGSGMRQQADVMTYCCSPPMPIQSSIMTTHATTLQITASQTLDKPHYADASIVSSL